MSLLTGQQIGELRDLLCEVFTVAELVQLFRTKLEVALGDIVALDGQTKPNIAFNLIEWLEARDKTIAFLVVVRAERATVDRVRLFCEPLVNPLPPGTIGAAAVPSQAQVRDRVIRFSAVFDERRRLLRYLNAYKALHDSLHKLHEMLEAIGQAAARFQANPASPNELRIIADSLEDELLDSAEAARDQTEFQEEGEWILEFRLAVTGLRNSLAPPDLAALSHAVKALGALPNEQERLNEEMVRCARRLLRDDLLVTLMDGILGGLGQIAGAADLQEGMTRFRSLCQQLGGLTADHDACQDVEMSLAAAATLGVVTRDRVDNWPAKQAALLRIAARRPKDRMAARVAQYARDFDEAQGPATDRFVLLREQFGRLFSKTDEDLLTVTDKLVQEAALLEARLKGFLP